MKKYNLQTYWYLCFFKILRNNGKINICVTVAILKIEMFEHVCSTHVILLEH